MKATTKPIPATNCRGKRQPPRNRHLSRPRHASQCRPCPRFPERSPPGPEGALGPAWDAGDRLVHLPSKVHDPPATDTDLAPRRFRKRPPRRWRGFGCLLLAALPLFAVPAAAVAADEAVENMAASTIDAGDLTIALDAMGVVTGLTDPGDTDHNVAAHPTTLVSLVVEDAATDAPTAGTEAHYKPTGWSYAAGTAGSGESARGEYTFSFADSISAVVTAVEKPGYATLELTSVSNPNSKDIRLVLWGPLTTDIDENIGDQVGVVSERDFAIGLFGTNARTRGGWPQQYEAAGFESMEVGGHIDYPDRWRTRVCRNNFEVCAAAPMTFGTILQAFTRDYTVERLFDPWSIARRYAPRPIPPLTGNLAEHGKLVGSKVAVFGVERRGAAAGNRSLRDVRDAEVLDRIGAVEVGEGMPHPIIDKVWGKKAEKANAPYFIFTDLNTSKMSRALRLANDVGWRGIYRDSGWGVFGNGALTSVSSNFGGNDAGLRAATNQAKAKHVSFATHSLFSFVPGSTGGADPTGLTVLYYGELVDDISASSHSLTVRPLAGTTSAHLASRFRSDSKSNNIIIGNELIRRGSRALALPGGDFTVTIPAGQSSGMGTFTLSPSDDTADEPDETVTVSGSATDFNVAGAQLTLTDDDGASDITLSVAPPAVAEDAGAVTVTVTATLPGATTLAADTDVTVSVAGGTATAGTDYAAVSAFTVTIPARQSWGTGTFTLSPSDDTADEPDETVTVSGSATDFNVAGAQLTLTDDDGASDITLSVAPAAVAEDAVDVVVTVTATLPGATTLAADTDVTVSVAGGTATAGKDYESVVVLSSLSRGRAGTTAAAHSSGTRVGLLGKPAYQGEYVAGLRMMYDTLAPRLVQKLDLGITGFSYDGSEWITWTEYADLGQNLVMEKVFNDLADNENFVHDAANALPYTWHINSRYNWGETANNILEAQQRRRWATQAFFRRNFMLPQLGWWSIDDANEWRWALSKAAAFDAGFAYFGAASDESRYGAALRAEIRGWNNATLAGAFDWRSRFLMQEADDYFRLDKVQHGRAMGPTWKLSDWAKSGNSGGSRSNGRYLAPQLRGFPLANLARDARVTVSGVVDPSYSGGLAVDTSAGVGQQEGGFRASGEGEWAIAGTAADKWIELTWDGPRKIRQIILFDREFANQNTTAGTLTFTHADNTTSTQAVTGIAADGSPKIVDFAQKTVTKVRFAITASSGDKPGLAEFVVLGPNPHYQSSTLATNATVTGVTSGQAARVNDGTIATNSANRATLTGTSAVLDLGGQYYLGGLGVWHRFDDARTYHDVVFEVADNDQFNGSTVVFNNDADDSLGRGAGTDAEYVESSAGKLVQFAPVAGRYVRLWSNGSDRGNNNFLVEVEVYGTGNGTTDVAAGGVTAANSAASDLGNAIDHDPDTLADVGTGKQYLQLDLGGNKTVDSLLVMRDNADMRVYKGVVYRLSTTPDFSADVTTVFHNDNDNLHGLGLGESTDTQYSETENGRYVRFAPVTVRYVRLYSAGSNYDDSNRYREVLVGTQAAGTAAPSTDSDTDDGTPGERRVITPTAISQTQGDTNTNYSHAINNLIDGSGLSATPTASNLASVTHSGGSRNTWQTATQGSPNYFSNSNNPDPQFTLTLDDTYGLNALVVWGWDDNTNAASDFTVEFSTDGGVSYSTGTETVQTSGVLDDAHAELSFDAVHQANFVRLTITNNANGRGFSGAGGDRVALGEIRFLGTAAADSDEAPTAADGSLVTLVNTAGTLDLSTLVSNAGATPGYSVTNPSNDSEHDRRDGRGGDLYAEYRLPRFGQLHLHGDGREQRQRHRHGRRDRPPCPDGPGHHGDDTPEHGSHV